MPQEEGKHAGNSSESRLADLYPESGISVVMDADSDAPKQITIHPHAVTASAVILSAGAVAALFFFIYLCFAYPDSANIVIPLVLYPMLRTGVDKWRAYKASKKYERLSKNRRDSDTL